MDIDKDAAAAHERYYICSLNAVGVETPHVSRFSHIFPLCVIIYVRISTSSSDDCCCCCRLPRNRTGVSRERNALFESRLRFL